MPTSVPPGPYRYDPGQGAGGTIQERGLRVWRHVDVPVVVVMQILVDRPHLGWRLGRRYLRDTA